MSTIRADAFIARSWRDAIVFKRANAKAPAKCRGFFDRTDGRAGDRRVSTRRSDVVLLLGCRISRGPTEDRGGARTGCADPGPARRTPILRKHAPAHCGPSKFGPEPCR